MKAKNQSVIDRLKAAYDDLAATHTGLRESKFEDLVEAIGFFSPGITVKLVNGETDEDVAVKSPYNLFVGGNKLGQESPSRTCWSAITGAILGRPKPTLSCSTPACTVIAERISDC